MSPTFSLVRDLQDIDVQAWDELVGDHPLAKHAFLLTLHDAHCAVPQTGWAPHFLLMHRDRQLAGAMPLYLKSHSRGEYVFDHAWAHAFARHGLAYYPKLLSAIPFTPVPGPRLLAHNHADRVLLARQAISIGRENGVSSLHVLFPDGRDERALREAGFMVRDNVQFHWFNDGYRTYDEFLANLSQQKRKKIKQDSRKVEQAGVRFTWLEGAGINNDTLRYFYQCYERTYMEHGNAPYLSYAFFELLQERMPDSMVLVLAEQDNVPVAAALNIRGADRLYGRYWGCTRYIPGLHFEACYIQGIAYCIARGLSVFEGGAQGEHKLSRGMLPVRTCSAHWIADERYAEAIMEFLAIETPSVGAYLNELHAHSPFRQKPV